MDSFSNLQARVKHDIEHMKSYIIRQGLGSADAEEIVKEIMGLEAYIASVCLSEGMKTAWCDKLLTCVLNDDGNYKGCNAYTDQKKHELCVASVKEGHKFTKRIWLRVLAHCKQNATKAHEIYDDILTHATEWRWANVRLGVGIGALIGLLILSHIVFPSRHVRPGRHLHFSGSRRRNVPSSRIRYVVPSSSGSRRRFRSISTSR